jgi:short subunit dehydrogenase-like uncharacterized protein
MADHLPWLLYGANGYTGRLIAEEAVRREMRPVLAGRDAAKTGPLAAALGCPVRIFSLENSPSLAEQLGGVRAVLNCAGPFSATAGPLAEGCIAAKVHYLDVTGEIAAIEALAAAGRRAAEAGISLIPAVGFDVVPSDCLAAMLGRRLPGAKCLQLAFTFTGGPSPGTAATILEAIPRGGRVRQEGRIEEVPLAWKSIKVPFPDDPRWAMTVPWGDVATAWHSTGIPNIEVYMAVPWAGIQACQAFRPLLPLLGTPAVARAARWWIARFVRGPSAAQRQESRGCFWGRVRDGKSEISATLTTPGGYPMTVHCALACLQQVLAGRGPPGFSTPSKAFGADFVLRMPGTEIRWPIGRPMCK